MCVDGGLRGRTMELHTSITVLGSLGHGMGRAYAVMAPEVALVADSKAMRGVRGGRAHDWG